MAGWGTYYRRRLSGAFHAMALSRFRRIRAHNHDLNLGLREHQCGYKKTTSNSISLWILFGSGRIHY
jgi:hypothetical protein